MPIHGNKLEGLSAASAVVALSWRGDSLSLVLQPVAATTLIAARPVT